MMNGAEERSDCPPNTEKLSETAGELNVAALYQRLGAVGPLAIAASTLPLVGLIAIISQLNAVAPWLKSHDSLGVAMYVGGFALLAGVAILPTHAAAILGGWAFGFAIGYPAALAGFLGGALLGYSIARPAAGTRVTALISEHPKWKAVYDALLGSGVLKSLLIVALLRLPPNSPFAITNLVFAATRVPLIPFAVGTLLGMAPRIGLIVWAAHQASALDLKAGPGRWTLAIGIAVTLAVLAIVGSLAKRAIDRVTAASGKSNQ
ncbi:MAG: TVP38/TMEM64 family protein [Planctomycetes bacterium]|nr:TVP38/TMEM64 family protein [Planctomycetota bacterium]